MNQVTPNHMSFFLVCPPGLEAIVQNEFIEKWPQLCQVTQSWQLNHEYKIEMTYGGIELKCDFTLGLLLNAILRSPTKILLRLADCQARDGAKLFHKCRQIKWSLWLPGTLPEIDVSLQHCRLFDERKIKSAVSDAIAEVFKNSPPKTKHIKENKSPLRLSIRGHNDHFQISLDTSGTPLYKRQQRVKVGVAPLRENLAYSLLTLLINPQSSTLIDPMCGSGVLLIEALAFNRAVVDRDFSFEVFPHVKILRGQPHWRKKLEVISWGKPLPYKNFLGMDIDAKMIDLCLDQCPSEISFKCHDFFHMKVASSTFDLVLNPPYGQRIKSNFKIDDIINKINSLQQCKQAAFIFPTTKGLPPEDYRLKAGGLDLSLIKVKRD